MPNPVYTYIYIYIYTKIKSRVGPILLKFHLASSSGNLVHFCNWLYFVLSTLCNCSIAAFYSGFSFDQLIAYLLIFFQLV